MKNNLFLFIMLLTLSSCLRNEDLKISNNSVPEDLNDGWTISTPVEEGVDPVKLDAALEGFFSEQQLHNSKALLIAKNGKLITEAYAKHLDDRDRKHNVKSVTKSITTTLIGVAIQEGILDPDLDRKVYEIIPEHFDEVEEKREITISHCLRMSTGLEDPVYAVNVVLPGNAVATCLGVRLVDPPGTRHVYNNGSANILSGVISKLSDQSYEAFAQANLFNPLGITDYHWVKHLDQSVNAAFDLYLYPRDLLTWGQFCLQDGDWKGEQILPETWMGESTTYYEDGFDGPFGYHWWIQEQYDGYYSNGHGGQRVWIIPDKDLVIVHLAEPSTDQTDLTEVSALLDVIMEAM